MNSLKNNIKYICCYKIVLMFYNVPQLIEVGDYKAQNFKLK